MSPTDPDELPPLVAATPSDAAPPIAAPHGRAGRNLPAAIGVGVALALAITVPLFTVREGFVAVVVLATVVGVVEMARALRVAGAHLELPPLLVIAVVVGVSAWTGGAEGLALSVALSVAALVAFHGLSPVVRPGPPGRRASRDLAASVLTIVYVPFLAGFALLLTIPPDGPRRVTAFILVVVANDVGGYAAGVLSGGKHKLAPSVSPGKSWEGLAGSAGACAVTGLLLLTLTLPGGGWWEGLLYGLAVCVSATVGDLGESMLKRDIGIKDMGNLLPGHGGIMDRLDSLLPTAPIAWLLLGLFVPFGA